VIPSEPRFERIRRLGEGATATVDLARLTEPFAGLPTGAAVAVKTLGSHRAGSAEARAAFRAEAEAGMVVHDPSLVRVLHHGEASDGKSAPYLLLSYVPGPTLREMLAEGPLPEPLVRSVGAELASALAALHAAGLVHGDVKPENVRLDEEGRAVLLDLGFASRLSETESRRDAGSLAYLSPERVRGGPPSAAADVFALGITLYEVATGIHPFACTTGPARSPRGWGALASTSGALLRRTIEVRGADELAAAIAAARCDPPSRLLPSLSPFFDHGLAWVLARDAARRPNARELARALSEGESGAWWRARLDPALVEDEPPSPMRQTSDWTPLVGREGEIQLLTGLYDRVRDAWHAGQAAQGRPGATKAARGVGIVWLYGSEGSGKWRLTNEFARRLRARSDPPLYLYGRWSEAAEARPSGALLVLLSRWLALPMGAEPGERERTLLDGLVGERDATTLLAALSPAASAVDASVLDALAAWLGALGRERTVLVFLDDLHVAGLVTLEALSAVLDRLGRASVFLVLGVRGEAAGADSELPRLEAHVERLVRSGLVLESAHIVLGPISQEAMLELVDELFDASVPRRRLAEVLWMRSGGNPGLATEILHDLIASGKAHAPEPDAPATPGDKLLLAIAPDELPLPRSLDRIVEERFATLDPEDRRWCERLAVVGELISTEFLGRAFPAYGPAEIDAVLARLVRLGWLVPYGDRYRFARPALRDALLRSIGEAKRRRLHLAAARGLASPLAEATSEELFQRAFHLREADEKKELLELCLLLLRRESRRASAQRLLTLARYGLDSLEGREATEELRRARLELLEAAADAADRLGRREDERRLLDYMTDLELDPERFPAEAARLYLLHARYAAGTGQYGLARGMLRNALQLAEASKDRGLVSQTCRRMAQVQAQVGQFEEGRKLGERALKLAQGENQLALAHLALAHLDVLEDRIETALAEVDRALHELRRSAEARMGVVSYAHLLRARIWRSAGRPRRALGAVQRALRLAHEAGERRLETEARARFGGLLLDLDRPKDAETELREAELLADEIEDRRGQVLVRLWLGLLLWEEEGPGAQTMIEREIELAREIGFFRAEAFGLAIRARMHRARAELEAADATSGESVLLVERHGAELADRIAILGTRVLVLRTLGNADSARAVEKELAERVERGRRRIKDASLRRDQRTYARRLLSAVLSPDGPVLPRTSPEEEPPRRRGAHR
jgi:serine/threonine protein kinase